MKMFAGPVLNKSAKIPSKTKRAAIAIVSGSLWLFALLIQIFLSVSGPFMWTLRLTSFVTCVVFFWNLSERYLERNRHFDEREVENKNAQ